MTDGVVRDTWPEPGLELPSSWGVPSWCPCDVPQDEDVPEREGLWLIVWREDGSAEVLDAPEPAKSPLQ